MNLRDFKMEDAAAALGYAKSESVISRVTFEDLTALDRPVLERLLRQAAMRLAVLRGTNEATELHALIALDLELEERFAELER